jgi:hypothetical protein
MTTKRQEYRPRSNAGRESGVGRTHIWEKTRETTGNERESDAKKKKTDERG